MKLLTGNSNKNLSQKISKFLKTKLVHSSIKKFSDGVLKIFIDKTYITFLIYFPAHRSMHYC